MWCSSVVALAACCACNQVAGIDPEDDGVPAISGSYVVGADMRTNPALSTVAILDATVAYDRQAHTAMLTLQPLTTGTYAPVGSAAVARLDVTPGSPTSYESAALAIDIPAEANADDTLITLSGTAAGVFHDATSFCGILTGSFASGSASGPLPSISFGAVKNLSPTLPVEVDCGSDMYAH